MKVLAAIDDTGASPGVVETAQRLARLLGVGLEILRVSDGLAPSTRGVVASGTGLRVLTRDPATAVVDALAADDAVMAVVGAGKAQSQSHPVGHITEAVMTRASKPVVVVPPAPGLPRPAERAKVVVLLDDTAATAEALSDILGRIADCGAEVLAVNVVDPASTPEEWYRYYYDFPGWKREFRRRNCLSPGIRLEVGKGSVFARVVDLAAAERATIVALAWSQDLAAGHASVVTGILSSARVPVLLVSGSAPPGGFGCVPASREEERACQRPTARPDGLG